MIPYGLIVYTQYRDDGTIEANGGSGLPVVSIPFGESTASGRESHQRAALALVRKIYGSEGAWRIVARGDNPSGCGFAFVFVQGAVREAA
jgi:hypothetical protein